MLSFLRPTAEEAKRAALIERRKLDEENRKSRIFNPQVRRFGIDKDFLDKQVEEKNRLREIEARRECLMDQSMIRNSKIAAMLEKQENEERRKRNKEMNDFRRSCQKSRVSEDSEPGIDVQKFEGEDENMKCRVKEQKKEMQAWIMQQIQERRAGEKERRDADKAYQNAVISRDRRVSALQKMELDCRRRLNEANANFNQVLAKEQNCRRRCEAVQEEEDKKADIYNHVTGDFLMESKEQAQSYQGPCKLLASRYKGMTSEELRVIYEERVRQILKIQKIKIAEKERNQNWDRMSTRNAVISEQYHREMERKKAQLSKQIAEENKNLAKEQKSYQDYLNRVVYKNKPSADFYEQFNKSTR